MIEDSCYIDPASAVDALISHTATKVMDGGAVTIGFGWALSHNMIAFIGLSLTIAGFFVNLLFQRRRDRREKEMHELKLQEVYLENRKKPQPKVG